MSPSSPKRPSKFIEALPQFDDHSTTSSTSTPTAITTPSDELFYSILHEMDDYETRQRQQSRERGGSQSSFDSLPSNNSSTRTPSFGVVAKEGRRSINFTRSSLDKELSSVNGEKSGSTGDGESAFAKKFVGRLRALTGGKREECKGVAYAAS